METCEVLTANGQTMLFEQWYHLQCSWGQSAGRARRVRGFNHLGNQPSIWGFKLNVGGKWEEDPCYEIRHPFLIYALVFACVRSKRVSIPLADALTVVVFHASPIAKALHSTQPLCWSIWLKVVEVVLKLQPMNLTHLPPALRTYYHSVRRGRWQTEGPVKFRIQIAQS